MVIFGVTGDLTSRKLAPALFDLYRKGILPKNMRIIGFARRNFTTESFQAFIKRSLNPRGLKGANLQSILNFLNLFTYIQGDFDSTSGYSELKKLLGFQDNQWKYCANKLFYLAVPPQHYNSIITNLDKSGLTEPCGPEEGWTRVILEKPFGSDSDTARKLDEKLGRLFKEEQIYRIDHFLGKESLQNILAFRFGNTMFEPLWNSKYIDHIQIIATETLGVETRGSFYDNIGALRDMVQSHLLQMTAAVAMEQPRDFESESIRDKRVKLLKALDSVKSISGDCIRGQYNGYKQEPRVSANSSTETFTALKLGIDNKCWRTVPFYLLTGKKLKKSVTRIVVHFKDLRHKSIRYNGHYCNRIIFEMKPEEKIEIHALMKEPGLKLKMRPHKLELDYGKAHSHELLDPYEKLIIDCMTGDQTLFARTDEIRASWNFITPILKRWEKSSKDLMAYKPGTWGPAQTQKLLKKDNRSSRNSARFVLEEFE